MNMVVFWDVAPMFQATVLPPSSGSRTAVSTGLYPSVLVGSERYISAGVQCVAWVTRDFAVFD
jgi:hypothetical protein